MPDARASTSARAASVVAASQSSGPTSLCRLITSRVSRADCAAAATATWNRDSARRRASASGARRSSADAFGEQAHVLRARPLRREVRARAEHGDVVVGQVAQLRRGDLAQPFAQHVGRAAAARRARSCRRCAPAG